MCFIAVSIYSTYKALLVVAKFVNIRFVKKGYKSVHRENPNNTMVYYHFKLHITSINLVKTCVISI